jgi:hypothetical protein
MGNWNKTAEYYERLANLHGRDRYSQRALLWYAETCRAKTGTGEYQSQAEQSPRGAIGERHAGTTASRRTARG